MKKSIKNTCAQTVIKKNIGKYSYIDVEQTNNMFLNIVGRCERNKRC
jgi:hypothetical protein